MTSFKQVAANRAGACKSTGPSTNEGNQRSRCNAVRYGLTAETVIAALEDPMITTPSRRPIRPIVTRNRLRHLESGRALCAWSGRFRDSVVFCSHDILAIDSFEPPNSEVAACYSLKMADEHVVHASTADCSKSRNRLRGRFLSHH